MAELSLSTSVTKSADTVVVGLYDTGKELALTGWGRDLDNHFRKAHGQTLLAAAQVVGASAKLGLTRLLPDGQRRLAVVGLGSDLNEPMALRRAVGSAVRTIIGADTGARQISLSFGLDEPGTIKAIGEGALLAAYRAPSQSRQEAAPSPHFNLVATSNAATKRAVILAQTVASAVNRTRDLVNQPPNQLGPADLAAAAETLAADAAIKITIWDEVALATEGFGGLTAVGGGSVRPPRLVRLSWRPRGAKTHVALVGKGITFDSGGLDLKPPASMYTMGSDMAGAATCLAAIVAAAELQLKVQVTAWLALAENLPSGSAFRPSDVLTLRGGTTVENYNTDAEGRLVLADALARAAEDEPDLIIDVATLTGAKQVALGNLTNAVMASDDTVADDFLTAAEAAGEAFWQLPITDEAEEALKSTVADLKSGGKREGGALVAAAFLRHFTAGRPWAHLDIAGSAFNTGEARDCRPAGATGVAVSSLIAWLARLSA
ncbi:MAG: leucyl aminopeptidase [Propionibacteriaceae bacterium]|jgi:leucyl aminopeptidase|nr:leucyl aminopeptidase [Propionibacteriaceae bacterium]